MTVDSLEPLLTVQVSRLSGFSQALEGKFYAGWVSRQAQE